jgi:hypothetical protein
VAPERLETDPDRALKTLAREELVQQAPDTTR